MKVHLYICVFIAILHLSTGQRRKKVNAVLYEKLGGHGARINYDAYATWFDDTEAALELAGMSALSWICVEAGVFLMYVNTEYRIEDPREVTIISGVDKCTTPPPLGIGSFRHSATKFISAEETPHITIFTERFYGGFMYTVTSHSDHGLSRLTPVQSVMLVGPTNWTVTTQGGQTFCLTTYREKEDDVYVCIVPDVSLFLLVEIEDDLLMWKRVQKECDAGLEEKYINTCFDYYSGEINGAAVSPILPTTTTTTAKPGSEEAANNTNPGDPTSPFYGLACGDFEDLAYLLRLKVTQDFQSNYNFLVPKNKAYSWRTELLDLTFDIGMKLLAPVMSSQDFLPQIRETFVFFLEKFAWAEGKGWPEKKPTKDLAITIHETKACLEGLPASGFLEQILQTYQQSQLIGAQPVPEGLASPSPFIQKGLDMVMEFIYQIFLLVSATCHRVNQFRTNYWLEYNHIFDDMYIAPMVDHWAAPAEVAKYYSIIFGGLDLDLQYKRVEASTKVVYSMFQYYEFHPRPEKIYALLD